MQDLLVNWFGATGATVVRYAFALIVVIGLLLLLRWVLRTYVAGGQLTAGRGRQNRLSIVDQVVIDQRRRLLLVRRDGVEHLILIGGGNDLVVEPTIIRGVPVGSLGRARPAAPPAADETEVADEPVRDPTPAVAPRAAAPVAPAPVQPVQPVVRPSFPSHVAEHPKATSIQARINRTPPRKSPEPARTEPASPYIPPEAHRVEPAVSPIAPIIPDRAPAAEPAPEPQRAPVEPPVAAAEEPSFDDLARQLDEALKSEIEDIKAESLPPIPAPVEPPKAEPARPVVPAASAWLRPRNAQQPRPFVPREPTVAAPAARTAPAVEPPAPPIEAPEPVVVPRVSDNAPAPAVEAPSQDDRPASDFSSLESEMARLLDELAGDSKGKR